MPFSTAPLTGLPLATALLLWLPPLLLALTAGLALRRGATGPAAPIWRLAHAGMVAAGVCAIGVVAAVAWHGSAHGAGWRADLPGALVGLLVAFIGWVIVRFMRTYLDGEPGARAAAGWLAATLAAVMLVVATDHLAVLAAAWLGTSLALHRLLLFFGDRPAARVAAHKKFLFSRAADAGVITAAGLLYATYGTWSLGDLLTAATATGAVPATAQMAMGLLVVAAALKCAQLPFHGWLIQVMEAPTPVSALLHAGVVNLGGFVLIRFWPLLAEVPAATTLLALIGASTAVLAALVMSTRISIKVMLAWSTAAQMGFMLLQIALGLPEMALLHLLAHSLYKAHAFLSAGGAVRRQQLRQLAPAATPPGAARWVVAALTGLALTAAAAAVWNVAPAAQPALWLMAAVVSLALVPLLMGAPVSAAGAHGAWRWGALAALPWAYFGLHTLFHALLAPVPAMPGAALIALVAALFAGLYAVQAVLAVAPRGALARRLYPWFYGGLFLDDAVSRLAFRLSPPHPKTPGAAS